MRLLVIDGNSIANRAFYGIKLLTTKDGRYTNAIFGFLNILLSLLKECGPDEVAVAFDLKAPTFRHKMYDGYKATRHKMPDELAAQMPVLKELLAALGYREVTAEGWEADDILGTLSAACAARSDDCFLATGDRDSLQLVSDTTTVLLATTAMSRSKTAVMDVDAVKEKYGVSPRQLIDVKSLMGDTSDNIPGVKGIGEKSAITLIQKYGSLAGVYAHLDDTADKTIKPKQREHLAEDRAMAELSYTLGTIRTDAPIDTAEGAYVVGEGNKAEAVRLMQELELLFYRGRLGAAGKHRVQVHHIGRKAKRRETLDAVAAHELHAGDDARELGVRRRALECVAKKGQNRPVPLKERHAEARRREQKRVLAKARRAVDGRGPIDAAHAGSLNEQLATQPVVA